MKKYYVILSIIFAALTSCGGGSGGDVNGSKNSAGGSGDSFQGAYTGTFTGTAAGTWNLVIDDDGNVTGNASTTTAPITNILLSGFVDETGASTLVSGTAGDNVSFIINITNDVITGTWSDNTGGGDVLGALVPSDVLGAFFVGVELMNFTFVPLNVFDLTDTFFTLSINNDQSPSLAYYDSHGLLVVINPTDGTVAAISYAYFNTGASAGADITSDYLYLRNCAIDPCSSVKLNVSNRTLTLTNTELPVDIETSRLGITNLATKPATISGSISW